MESDDKTARILSCNNIKKPVEGKCGFFVKRKQRYCKMLPAQGNVYCAEHLCEDKEGKSQGVKRKRIACPLDQKHSVFEDSLSKHLKKCNATRKTQLVFYSENINLGIVDIKETDVGPLYQLPVDELRTLIAKIQESYNEFIKSINIKESFSLHSVLDEELKMNSYKTSVKKHLLQQASLVHILDDLNVLQSDGAIIEFGAGRGALSHWIQKAMSTKVKSKFFLVDRQHNRNKLDCYHKGDDQGPNFERLNIDIQHLNLGLVESLMDNDLNITAVGKHLCGGATDLSLRCLFEGKTCSKSGEVKKKVKQQPIIERLHSILFALCCYHRCTWNTYVGNEYLNQLGFTSEDFKRLTKMAAWATCGFERRDNESTHGQESEQIEDGNASHENEKLHVRLGLSSTEQVEIGRMCKRLIDYGRIKYIKKHGFDAELRSYVKNDVTPENITLCVKRKI